MLIPQTQISNPSWFLNNDLIEKHFFLGLCLSFTYVQNQKNILLIRDCEKVQSSESYLILFLCSIKTKFKTTIFKSYQPQKVRYKLTVWLKDEQYISFDIHLPLYI